MDKALGVIGRVFLVQTMVAPTNATTEEITVQINVSEIAENHPKSCKFSFVTAIY